VILVLPLSGDEALPRALPVTLTLIAVNLTIFLLTSGSDAHALDEKLARLERIAEWSLREARRADAQLAERADRFPTALAFVDHDQTWPTEIASEELRRRLAACVEDYRALRGAHAFFRYGFVPAEPGPWRLVAHQFVHADLLHLGFNMLFLWAVGAIVEATLGPGPFLACYLASGVAAALTHAAANPTSAEPVIGASGAIAGVMGLLAILHGGCRLRLALVAMLAVAPRILVFSLPASVFIGLWLLEQIFFAAFGSTALGVAFGAHLGGFCCGGLLGAGRRFVLKRTP